MDPRREARRIARQVGVPVNIFMALISHESGWRRTVRSPAGAIGYGQLMPGTARGMGVTNPLDPIQNLTASARYLKRQIQAFGSIPLGLAAYNAGPGAVHKYRGIPPYEETQAYVRNILRDAGAAAGATPAMASDVRSLGGVQRPTVDPRLRAALTPDPLVHNLLQRSVGEDVANVLSNPIPLPSMPATRTPSGGLPAIGTTTKPGQWRKYVVLGPGADRQGVHTQPSVLEFVGELGQKAGRRLMIGTGTNHNHLTVNGRVSDHWSGHAGDIPATGRELRRLGYLALIQAGMNPQQAARARRTGGLFNVGRYQIIFATDEGGNHYNHLHVGVRG